MYNHNVLESVFQRRLLKDLRSIPESWWFVKEAKAIRGIPDIIGCIKGRMILLEVKRSDSEARLQTGRIVLQKYQLEQARKGGALGYIIHPENRLQILQELLQL